MTQATPIPVAGSEQDGAAAFLGPVSTLPVNGIEIGFRQFGTGPELVMVTGRGTSMSMWTVDLLQSLAEHFHVTIFDNRGVGYTSDDTSTPLTVALMADDTAGFIEALGLGRPTVLGWSMGGQITLTLAVTHPDVVSRLITTGADTGGRHSVQSSPETGAALSDPDPSPATLLGLLFPPDSGEAAGNFVQQYVLQTQRPIDPQTLARQKDAEADWATNEATYDGLPNVTVPTLVTQGTEDVLVPPANADIIKSRIPQAQVIMFDGAGHGMQFQDTPTFVSDVVTFTTS